MIWVKWQKETEFKEVFIFQFMNKDKFGILGLCVCKFK